MTNRTKSYYVIREIVRVIVWSLITFAIFIGIHAAVAATWPALIVAAVFWGFYALLVMRDRVKLAR